MRAIVVFFIAILLCSFISSSFNPFDIVTQEKQNLSSTKFYESSIFHSRESFRQASFLIPVDVNIKYYSDYVDDTWLSSDILRQFRYRIILNITEPSGIPRKNYPIIFEVEFPTRPPGMCRDDTILLTDENGNPIPFAIVSKTVYTYEEAKYLAKATIATVVNISANGFKILHLYWSDDYIPSVPRVSGSLSLSTSQSELIVSNSIGKYSVKIRKQGDVRIFFDNTESFLGASPTIIPIMPQNGTYIILDTVNDTPIQSNRKDYDHIKVIAWEDSTHLTIYGFNNTSRTWEMLFDSMLYKHQMINYPPEPSTDSASYGYFLKYKLVEIVSDKPISVIMGDLGSNSTRNAWGVDDSSDDDIFSYYGFVFVGWVPRDLWISAYYNDTLVKIYDLSDSDDNYEITLNASEWWFVLGGSNSNTFDNDIVRIEASHPVTIIGGFIDDDIFTLIHGNLMKEFIFPCPGYTGITSLRNNTKIEVVALNSSTSQVIYKKSFILDEGEGIYLNFTSNITVQTDGDSSLDEFVVVKITANNSITVTSESAVGSNLASGETLFTGSFFAFALAKDRYVQILALSNSTTVKIYRNGTSELYYNLALDFAEYVNIYLPGGNGFIINSSKPIAVKIMDNNENYTSEDLSMRLIMGKPVISQYDIIMNSDCFVKLKVRWTSLTDLIIEDTYYFWTHANYFLLIRNISNPKPSSFKSPMLLVDLTISHALWHRGITFDDANYITTEKKNIKEFIILPNNSIPWTLKTGFASVFYTSNLQFSYGILNFIISPPQKLNSITGYIIDDNYAHFLVGWNSLITLLAGSYAKLRSIFMRIPRGMSMNEIVNRLRSTQLGKYLDIYVIGNGKISGPLRFDIETLVEIDLISLNDHIETSYRKVLLKMLNLNSHPVKMNFTLTSPSLNVEFSADLVSNVILENVPASEDYSLQVVWKNQSMDLCPLLNETIPIVINASVNITIIAYLYDLDAYITTRDLDPLTNANITLKGYVEETCVYMLNVSVEKHHMILQNLPVGKDVNITYNLSVKYYAIYKTVYNETSFALAKNNLVSEITIQMPLSKTIVKTVDMKNNTIANALVFLIHNNSIVDTKVTNSSGLTEFRFIPLGDYIIHAEFGDYHSDNVTISLTQAKFLSIQIRVVIGALRCAIIPRKTFYEARWGSTVLIEVEFWDIDANVRISADSMNMSIIDPQNDIIILETKMTEYEETVGVYYAIISLDERFIPRKEYIMMITASKSGYEFPPPQNITLRVLESRAALMLSSTNVYVYWQDVANITAKYIALEPNRSLIHNAYVNATLIYLATNEKIKLPNLISIRETNVGYEILVNTRILNEPGDYLLKITAEKEFYEKQEAEAIIRVIKRETFPIVSSTDIDLIWGNVSKITITLLDLENRTPMTCFDWNIEVIKNGEVTEEKFGLYMKVEDDNYILLINTVEMEVAEYKLLINFTHKIYKPTLITIRITVKRVVIQLVLKAPDKILKDPFLGYAETNIQIETRNLLLGGKPIENAYIEILIVTLTGDVVSKILTKYVDGVYEARIIWTGIEPDTYRLVANFIAFKVNETLIPVELRANIIGEKEKTVLVDYWGGTIQIAGKKISIVGFSLLLTFIFSVLAIVLKKLLYILRYPPEAREILAIIKALKKGEIPEIVIDRTAQINELVRIRLGIEKGEIEE